MTTNTNNYYIYIYLDPRSNPPIPIYVGKGKGKRMYDHSKLGSKVNIILKRKIIHIRESGLEPIIKKIHENLNNTDAINIESDLIIKFGRIHDNTGTLCNFKIRGDSGFSSNIHKIESRIKMSMSRKGKKQTSAQYIANCNRKFTDEHRRKISESGKGRVYSKESIQKGINSRKGYKHSLETIEKIKTSRKNFVFLDEHKVKMSKNSKRKKSILQYDLNHNLLNTWDSINECCKFYNYKHSNIVACCRGRLKTYKKYIWKYK